MFCGESLLDHLVSIGSEDETYRLLRAVSAQMGKPQADVIVLNKCIDLARKDQAACNAAADQRRSDALAGTKCGAQPRS